MSPKNSYQKNDSIAPGFKAVIDILDLLLCTNACGFMIKPMVIEFKIKNIKPNRG